MRLAKSDGLTAHDDVLLHDVPELLLPGGAATYIKEELNAPETTRALRMEKARYRTKGGAQGEVFLLA